MKTETIFSAQYNGARYQVRKISIDSGEFVKYDILQDRRVLRKVFYTKRAAILDLLYYLIKEVVRS